MVKQTYIIYYYYNKSVDKGIPTNFELGQYLLSHKITFNVQCSYHLSKFQPD